MYKKITKTTKVVKVYSTPAEEEADKAYEKAEADAPQDNSTETTTTYGDTINMDVPFFIKLLEHVQTRVTTPAELQVLAESIIAMSKTTPCITSDEFRQWAGISL